MRRISFWTPGYIAICLAIATLALSTASADGDRIGKTRSGSRHVAPEGSPDANVIAGGVCAGQPEGTPCPDTDGKICTIAECNDVGACDQERTVILGTYAPCAGECTNGACEAAGNCIPKPADTPCPDTDGNICTGARCDGAGNCDQSAAFDSGASCNTGFPGCTSGTCSGPNCRANPGTCPDTDLNPCTIAQCLSTGCDQTVPKSNGTPCPDMDNNVCTIAECDGGICDQTAAFDSGASCNTGFPGCTSGTCSGPNCTVNPVTCTDTDNNPCTTARCLTTGCDQSIPKDNDTPCPDTDNNVCTIAECDGGICDQTADFDSGEPCNTGFPGCTSGTCSGPNCTVNPGTCPDTDLNPCTFARCDSTGCNQTFPVAGNPTCDDGSACTNPDTCQNGTCVGSNPVVCTALDQCHDVGICDPATGVCSDPPKPDGTPCDDGDECTHADTCQLGVCEQGAQLCRVNVSEKGSILYFSGLEVGVGPAASVTAGPGPGFAFSKDTFITLVNDLNREVCIEWHFVNGDPPLAAIPGIERAHPGWNSLDCVTCLTPHENVYLSLSRGDGSLGCQPFTGLDPGTPPGRPDPDGLPGDRIIRGFAIAFAVDIDGNPISWNHLSGHVTVVDYRNHSAWEYNSYAFQCVADPVAGNPCGIDPATLSLDGVEYALAWDRLLFDFYAVGSTAFSRLSPATAVTLDTEMTLHPVSVDLRPNSTNTSGPVLTRADIVIWNENEDDRTGTTRCINCWDQTLLSDYEAPNNFLIELLNTNKGYARINGVKSDSCDAPGSCCCATFCRNAPATACSTATPCGAGLGPCEFPSGTCFDPDCDLVDLRRGTPDRDCSENAALLGLSDKILTFLGAVPRRTDAGMTLVGIGNQPAAIQRNLISPTAPLEEDKRAPREGSR